ncbi:MAG TPA: tryptophan-rich sensory protein [Pyrinomonadaceae bacterium]
MLSPTFLSVIICFAAAILEGALVGKGARERLAQLRMPPYSPPFALWLVIGFFFYAMCLVILRHVLGIGLVSPSQVLALVLTIMLLLANALWSVLFFRWRDLRVSFIAFVPYAVLVAVLVILLTRTYPLGALLLSFYCIYLIYATRWGYHLWRLNNYTFNQAMQRTTIQPENYPLCVCQPLLATCLVALAPVADLVSR